jgi:uncharacterized protein (TIGR02588 family)
MAEPRGISVWEWIAAAIATAMVGSIIGTLLVKAREERTPVRLTVSIERVVPSADGFVVEFAVSNRGGTTAAQVVVEGRLRAASGEPEVSTVTFDYVPDASQRRGGLLFRTDPRAGQLTVRALGYREP